MSRTRPVLTDTVPIQTIRASHAAPARRARPNTSGRGWHQGATQPLPVVRTTRTTAAGRVAAALVSWTQRIVIEFRRSDSFPESPAQQRALEHLAIHRSLGR